MVFADRDLVCDADHLLENFAPGRARNRVLHFVNRRPGLTIAELLDILKITKQSLNRVLKDRLDQDYVVSRPGPTDRRQSRMFPTQRGEALALAVAQVRSKRFARVFAHLPGNGRASASAFLPAISAAGERDKAAALRRLRPRRLCG